MDRQPDVFFIHSHDLIKSMFWGSKTIMQHLRAIYKGPLFLESPSHCKIDLLCLSSLMYFFISLFLLFPTPLARSHVLAVNFVKDGSLSFTLKEARLAHQADIDHPHCQRHCLPSFHFYSPSPVSIKTHKYQSDYYQLRQELFTL